MRQYLLLMFGLVLGFSACVKAPDYPPEPEIEFLSLSRAEVRDCFIIPGPSCDEDSVVIRFGFKDGDGDIGFNQDNTNGNIFIVDSRTGNIDSTYRINAFKINSTSKVIDGEIALTKVSFFCNPNNNVPNEDVSYSIYIKDRAGNVSNTITTSAINIQCQ